MTRERKRTTAAISYQDRDMSNKDTKDRDEGEKTRLFGDRGEDEYRKRRKRKREQENKENKVHAVQFKDQDEVTIKHKPSSVVVIPASSFLFHFFFIDTKSTAQHPTTNEKKKKSDDESGDE